MASPQAASAGLARAGGTEAEKAFDVQKRDKDEARPARAPAVSISPPRAAANVVAHDLRHLFRAAPLPASPPDSLRSAPDASGSKSPASSIPSTDNRVGVSDHRFVVSDKHAAANEGSAVRRRSEIASPEGVGRRSVAGGDASKRGAMREEAFVSKRDARAPSQGEGGFQLKVKRLDVRIVNHAPPIAPQRSPPLREAVAESKGAEESLERHYLGRFYLDL